MELGDTIAQCAEAKVFACNFFGHEAVVKVRQAKPFRHPVLDQKLREQRTVREARALVRCRKFQVPAPVVYAVDRASCTIVMERVPGLSAKEVIHACTDAAMRNAVGGRVLQAMGEIVGLLHQGDMIHGDLTTSNFIVMDASQFAEPAGTSTPAASSSAAIASGEGGAARHNGLVVIDFGLVSDKNSAEERAVDLYVLERAVSSAHPLLSNPEQHILAGYMRTIDPMKGKQTLDRLMAVRARGRKRSMIG